MTLVKMMMTAIRINAKKRDVWIEWKEKCLLKKERKER